jgi:hypothetical protein
MDGFFKGLLMKPVDEMEAVGMMGGIRQWLFDDRFEPGKILFGFHRSEKIYRGWAKYFWTSQFSRDHLHIEPHNHQARKSKIQELSRKDWATGAKIIPKGEEETTMKSSCLFSVIRSIAMEDSMTGAQVRGARGIFR